MSKIPFNRFKRTAPVQQPTQGEEQVKKQAPAQQVQPTQTKGEGQVKVPPKREKVYAYEKSDVLAKALADARAAQAKIDAIKEAEHVRAEQSVKQGQNTDVDAFKKIYGQLNDAEAQLSILLAGLQMNDKEAYQAMELLMCQYRKFAGWMLENAHLLGRLYNLIAATNNQLSTGLTVDYNEMLKTTGLNKIALFEEVQPQLLPELGTLDYNAASSWLSQVELVLHDPKARIEMLKFVIKYIRQVKDVLPMIIEMMKIVRTLEKSIKG